MIQALGRGIMLRCPNCGKGHIAKGLFTFHQTCDHCHVRYEREEGEGTGAMILLLSGMPIFAIISFMVLYSTTDIPWGTILAGILVALVLAVLILYRHARGAWIAIIYITSGLTEDI